MKVNFDEKRSTHYPILNSFYERKQPIITECNHKSIKLCKTSKNGVLGTVKRDSRFSILDTKSTTKDAKDTEILRH